MDSIEAFALIGVDKLFLVDFSHMISWQMLDLSVSRRNFFGSVHLQRARRTGAPNPFVSALALLARLLSLATVVTVSAA